MNLIICINFFCYFFISFHSQQILISLYFIFFVWLIRAKSLKNKVTINQQKSVAELNAIIAKLTAELESLRRYAARLEKDLLLRDPKYDLNKVREEVLPLFFSTYRVLSNLLVNVRKSSNLLI